MRNNKILVTGGCGYIGSHVVKQLSALRAEVTVIDNLSSGFREFLLNGEELIEKSCGDLDSLAKILKGRKFDAAVHFAGSLIVEESTKDPSTYYRNNVANTLNFLDLLVSLKVPNIVFSSTAAVYGNTSETQVSENTPCIPESPYGHSKLMVEQIIQDFSKAYGIKSVILRYFNVAGCEAEGRLGIKSANATHLIKVACEAGTGKRDAITIYGDDYNTRDGSCIRDYIHVEDLASAHVSSLNYLFSGEKSDIFNCGYGNGYSVKEVLDTFQKTNNTTLNIKVGPRRPGDIAEITADNKKILAAMDWTPKFNDLSIILKDAFRWEQSLSK